MTKRRIDDTNANANANANAGRRPKRSRPDQSEPEFFQDQRELEDLWKQAFSVGTEWENIDSLSKYNWNFSNLEDAFEEGGILHGKKVYIFKCTEPQLVHLPDVSNITCIPVVVAVVSPFPPSDKIVCTSIQMAREEVIDMKKMKMDWVPYIPLGKRDRSAERLKTQIFVFNCVQRRAGLKHSKLEHVKKFQYCVPYIQNPLAEDEADPSTIEHIMYPAEPAPVVCQFDWEFDDLEEFTNNLISEETLSEDQKDSFKEFVKERVRERKRANREERENRRRAREELGEERVAAFQNMKFYKFYPVATPDTPDISRVKVPFINRYYGKAHQVI